MSLTHVHVIGAGLAGLASAVRLAGQGVRVTVHEAAGHAGGRCRSYHDSKLDRRIDNGNHMLLSGNRSAFEYLNEVDSADSLTGPAGAEFEFLDLDDGERWTVHPNRGRIPWWLLFKHRRIPDTRPADYLPAMDIIKAGPEATVASCLDVDTPIFGRFWEPLTVSVLNTDTMEASASLMGAVLEETFKKGGKACCPRFAREGLSESFVDPALEFLKGKGCEVRFSRRLRSLNIDSSMVTALDFGDEVVAVGDGEGVILAVPHDRAATLLPGITTPTETRAIVNAHFVLKWEQDEASMLGIINGVSQWLFVRKDIVSVTVSAADDLAEEPEEAIAERLWGEASCALYLEGADLPPYRIVKEKRATIAQTPEQVKLRPTAMTEWGNLFLAGDWTDTGLPATIEGAVRSGHNAANAVLGFS